MSRTQLLNRLKRDLATLTFKLETEGWNRLTGIRMMQVLQTIEIEANSPLLNSELAQTLTATLKHFVKLKTLTNDQEVRLLELCEAVQLYTLSDATVTQATILAVGEFSFDFKNLARDLSFHQITLQCLDTLPLNFEPTNDKTLLLMDLEWLQKQSSSEIQRFAPITPKFASWICLTPSSSSLSEQLPFLRQGVTHFLNKPLRSEQLVELIEESIVDGRIDPFRIMVVDDEKSALQYYSYLMEKTGMKALPVNNPLDVPELLDEFRPDVILVDVEMPECRGPELVTLVRQCRRHAHLSAIYVTGTKNEELINFARRSADDIFQKNSSPDVLVTLVTAQAKRHRRLERLERNELAKRLEHSMRLENFRAAVDQHAIVSMANVNGEITFVNERFCSISGYSLEELLGQNHRVLKSAHHPTAFYEDMWHTISSGHVWHGEVCNLTKQGREYWVRSTIMPFLDRHGVPEEYISIRTDITALKQTEHALTAREALYRSLITAVADGILVYEPDGRIIECNPAACSLFGVTRTTLLCTLAQEQMWIAPQPYNDDLPEHPAFRVFLTGRSIRNRLLQISPSIGNKIWIRVSAEPIFEEDSDTPKLVVLSCTDVTLQRDTEKQLQDHLAQMEATIRAIPDPLFELDATGLYHHCYHADPNMMQIFETRMKGRRFPEIFSPETSAELLDIMQEAAREGESYGRQAWLRSVPNAKPRCFEFSVVRKDYGESQQDHSEARLIVLARDITARKNVEDTLSLFRSLVEAADQAVRVADSRGNVEYVNAAYTRLTGYTQEEMQGRPYHDILVESNHDEVLTQIDQSLAQTHHWRGQLTLKRKDGSEFSSLSDINAIYDEHHKQLLHTFNMFIDYSEELAKQHLLEQAVAEANAANHAKSEFLSRMSHELRTPMNAIIGFAQLMEMDEELSEDNQDNVQEILSAGQHLLGLINEVLDLAKVESGRMDIELEMLSYPELIHSCVALSRPLAEKMQVEIQLNNVPDVHVYADAVRLKQVLLNLLSNAIKYNRRDGKVLIDSEIIKNDFASKIRVHIQDEGAGIPSERIPELFQPFNRLGAERSEVEGTGIGLVITRNLLELMNGKLGITSEPGKGSDFWFELPLGENQDFVDDEPANDEANTEFTHQEGETRTVLYVEDNLANQKLLKQVFSRLAGLELVIAGTADEVLPAVQTHKPHLILLDIYLNDASGYDILAKLRQMPMCANLPIIALTANAMPEDYQRGIAAGFDDYLTKPIQISQLIRVMSELLNKHHDASS